VTPRQGPEMNPPGLDDDTANGTRPRSVYGLLQAHDAYWSDPANVDHLKHSCVNDPQAVTNRRKVKPTDVVHVLRVLASTAAFIDLTANLTLRQIAARTLLSEPKVRDSIRVALIAELITNVTKEQRPTGRRPGRAPRRRLDYIMRALPRIEETTPTVGSTSSPNSAETTSKSADSRIALTTTDLHKTRAPATFDDASSSRTASNDWELQFRQRLKAEVRAATRYLSGNATNQQYGTRIQTTSRQAHERWASRGAPPDDFDLVRYYADTVVRGNGNRSTWDILQERYPEATSPPT
jgi:hypothetical protein